ncbi:hypothetical protein BBJ28_00002197 [Nothophytophthora sp. Chile5]|nr:hypothetical protein BBJ28_00002197 [Nothophytophthora sp. Chile5]
MQVIHELVTVSVTQSELRAHSQWGPDSDGGADAATTTLRYVAVNAGLSTVTFRTDFSESANIHLRFPSDKSHHLNSMEKAKTSQPLAFVCTLHPFERRILVYVLKGGKQRALVRVAYAVLSNATPPFDAIVEAQTRAATIVQQQQQSSNHTYSHLRKWEIRPHLSATEVNRACEEINRHFREYGTVFVDASFPPSAASLYEPEALEKLPESDTSVYSLCKWEHLHNAVDSSWTFMTIPSKRPKRSLLSESTTFASFTSGLPCQDSFLCAMALIAPLRDLWLRRWFPSLGASSPPEESVATPVKLCDRGLAWRHLVIDMFLPAFPLGRGLLTPCNAAGEWYAMLLHKAYAKLKGSYLAIASISTIHVLRELTGEPWYAYNSSRVAVV